MAVDSTSKCVSTNGSSSAAIPKRSAYGQVYVSQPMGGQVKIMQSANFDTSSTSIVISDISDSDSEPSLLQLDEADDSQRQALRTQDG